LCFDLTRKFRLNSLAKVFRKFGPKLRFKTESGKVHEFFTPKNLRLLPMNVRFDSNFKFVNLNDLLAFTWSKSLINCQFDEVCAICGALNNIEIHHVRSVKNIRIKSCTFAQWKGAFIRKSIPLCATHHSALHKAKLTLDEITILSKYKGKMSSGPN
jgi:hypothetical protein